MSLVVEVISYQGFPPPVPQKVHFEETGCTIGRGGNNNLVLFDSNQIISRVHGTISCVDGRFIYNNTGQNGTLLSPENRTLFVGDSVTLADRDQLKIGDYELLVHIGECNGNVAKESLPFDFAAGDQVAFEQSEPAMPPSDLDLNECPFTQSEPHAEQQLEFELPPMSDPGFAKSAPPLDWLAWNEEAPANDHKNEPISPQDLHVTSAAANFKIGHDDVPDEESVCAEETAVVSLHEIQQPEEPGLEALDYELALPPDIKISENRPTPDVAPPKPELDVDLFHCFLDGAGLDIPPDLSFDEQVEAMKAFGFVFRHTVDGIMSMLRARAEEKNEIRANVTLVQTEKNNPFKFLPTSEAAINVMLYKKYQKMGFLDPLAAIKECFTDLTNHEIAMRMSMKVSIKEIIQKFDPIAFADTQEGMDVFLSKKSKCWDAYCAAFPSLANEAMESIFKGYFAQAYEDKVQQLNQTQDKN